MKFTVKYLYKFTAVILSVVCIVASLPLFVASASAALDVKQSESGEYIYEILPDKTINLLGFQKNKSSIDIPEEIDGYTVTKIDPPKTIKNPIEGFGYFGQENTILTSVILPETLTYLGDDVFEKCSVLNSVYIPQSVYYIGCWAFYECVSLEHIIIPESCTHLGDAAFYGCSSLSSITFGDNISYIGPAAFEGCSSLASVDIPESVTEISDYVFADCRNLEICNIPSKVERIGVEAFRNCTKLQDFDIPKTTNEIDMGAFSGSGYYESENWEGDLLYLDNWLIASTPFIQDEVVIKEGIVGIAGGVFAERYGITDIDLPNSLKYIVEYAFHKIYSNICNYYEGVYYLENWALSSYSPDSVITLLDGTIGIASGAFQDLYFSEINLPESLRYIGSYAFCLCEGLITVNMAPVEYIGAGAFQYCEALEEIILPESLEYLGNSAFWSTALTEIVLPQGLNVIQPLTFGACDNFKKIVFGENIKRIYFDAFYECELLNEIYFDGTEEDWNSIVIEDGNEYFKEANLYFIDAVHTHTWEWVTVKEPTCLEKGSKYQKCKYVGCTATQNVTEIDATNEHNFEWIIDKSATCSDNGVKHEECTVCNTKRNENTVIQTTGNHEYEDGSCVHCNVVNTKDFYLGLSSDGTAIIMSYSGDATDFILPQYIGKYLLTVIDDGTFQEKTLIRSISIPKSVTYIGVSAFRNCISLETVYYSGTIEEWNKIYIGIDNDCLISATIICSDGTINGAYDYTLKDDGTLEITGYRGQNIYITIPSKIGDVTVTSIAVGAFYNSNIESVTIPDTVSIIKRDTFEYCRNLKRINFGNGVVEIENYAFTNTDLEDVFLGDNVQIIGPNAFSHHISNLYVSENNNYFTYSDGVLFSKDKSKLVFYLTSSYRSSYYIPNTVTEICDYAFNNATWLFELELSENVKKIGAYAFSDSINTEILLNSGLEEIGPYAFYNCNELESMVLPSTVKSIGNSAFSDCDNILTVTIPDGVTLIDSRTFDGCDKLTTITIPQSVKSIERRAFYGCSELTDVYYLGSDEDWSDVSINENGNDYLLNANIHFASTSHEHSWEWVIDADATCGNPGIKHEFCEGCSNVRNENTEIAPTRNHNFGWITDEEATCGKDGIKHEECSGCTLRRSMNTVIPATDNHDYKNATCTTPKTCKNCSKTSGKELGHTGGTATCKSKAKCTRCGNHYGSIDSKTHIKFMILPGYAATCSNTGLTNGEKCADCGKIIVQQKTIAKIPHNYKSTTTKATLTNNGSIIKKCSFCGDVESKNIINFVKTIKLSTKEYTYNGKNKTPSVVVKDSSGETLKKNTDYTVTYPKTCKNVGTYKVSVKMKGKYSGTKTLAFKINPAETKVSKLTAGKKSLKVAIAKKTTQTSGYQIQYSTSKSFKSYKTKTLSGYKKTSVTLKGLRAKKTYYVRVRTYKTVNGKKYYSSWSKYKYKKTK